MSSKEPVEPQHDKLAGCLARFFWMGVGNGALALLAVGIAHQEGITITLSDLGYWAVVAALIAVRRVDVGVLGGQTADGAPATIAHWRRYSAWLVAISLALWLAAHTAGRIGVFG